MSHCLPQLPQTGLFSQTYLKCFVLTLLLFWLPFGNNLMHDRSGKTKFSSFYAICKLQTEKNSLYVKMLADIHSWCWCIESLSCRKFPVSSATIYNPELGLKSSSTKPHLLGCEKAPLLLPHSHNHL